MGYFCFLEKRCKLLLTYILLVSIGVYLFYCFVFFPMILNRSINDSKNIKVDDTIAPIEREAKASLGPCCENFTVEKLDSSNGYSINIRGTLSYAIHTLNQVLTSTKRVHIASPYSFNNSDIRPTLPAKHKAIGNPAYSTEPYFKAIANYPQVFTIILRWKSLNDEHLNCTNLLPVKTYYLCKWPADNCNIANTRSDSCVNYLNASVVLKRYQKPPMGFFSFSNPKYIPKKIPGVPDHIFIHLVKDAILDDAGNVATSSLDIVPFQCHVTGTKRKGSYANVPVHEEVFVITQHWGSGFYHSSVEDLPRIVPFLEFLLAHPDIKVHVIQCCGIVEKLAILGIGRSRLVSGYMRVHLAYVPNGGGCGWLLPVAGPMLAARFREHIENTTVSLPKRNKIVLIQRSHKRWLAQHDKILAILKSFTAQFTLQLAVFSDKQLPALDVTMALFYQALVVVAPHGAGLSNLMFSQPGTAVIEIVMKDSPGCYRDMMQYLGHPYVGLLSDVSSEAMQVDLSYLRLLLSNILKGMTT